MMIAMRRRLFQALFCLTSRTLPGQAARKAAIAPAGNATSLLMITCGSTFWISGWSHTNATCVKQHLRRARGILCTGSSSRLRFLLKSTLPLTSPWKRQMEVSSTLSFKICLPAGICAVQKFHHCQTAKACKKDITTTSKRSPVSSSESGRNSGPQYHTSPASKYNEISIEFLRNAPTPNRN